MKNSELRDYEPAKLLTSIERQKKLILQEYSVQQGCPNCGHKLNIFEALGIDIDDYNTGDVYEGRTECTACHRELKMVVPFISMGTHWHWSLVPVPAGDGA